MTARADREAIALLRRQANTKNRQGLFRGIVEDIDDPDRLGRVKVRIWHIHGHQTPSKALPWAEIAEVGGGGYDFGSFNPPPVGSSVWIGSEDGDLDFPVVVGTFRGVPKRDDENPNVFLTKDGLPTSERAWTPPDDETETPKDIYDGVHDGDPHPTRRIWQKSYKGHTFLVEDGDGKEFLKIIDRAGQIIEMYCPVAVEHSESNKSQRGTRDATRGDQLPYDAMRFRRAMVRIKDLAGQEFSLNAVDQNEFILVQGTNRDGSSKNHIKISSGKGKEKIEIQDNSGSKIVLDPNSDKTIVLQDSANNKIEFDKEKGTINIRAAKSREDVISQKITRVDGKSEQEVKGDQINRVHGNLKTNVVNDAALGVLGNTLLSLGGAIKAVITNQAPSGKEEKAIDIQVAQPLGGDVSLAVQNGNIEASTLAGNITSTTTLGKIEMTSSSGNVKLATAQGNAELSTSIGNVTCKTDLGNAELSTTSGNVAVESKAVGTATLKAAAGIANVDGTVVRLGSQAAAIQPLIKGIIFTPLFLTFLTALQTYVNTIFQTVDAQRGVTNPLVAAIGALSASMIPGASLSLKTFTE